MTSVEILSSQGNKPPSKASSIRSNDIQGSYLGSSIIIPTDTNVEREAGLPEGFKPPEGGWGWMVCFASFWTNGTLFGILNIFGILYVEFLEEFKDEGENAYFKLSWIGSLEIATTFFMSIFSSILIDQFGIQLMSGIGAAIATAGMLISSFVYKLEVLYITYGIMIGLGGSLVYTPSISILSHYFEKRLGIVNGIVSFGSAVFTLVLGLSVPKLLNVIGLRNTMRVLTGVIGVLGVCPFIWKPLIPDEPKGVSAITSRESIYEKCGGCSRKIKKVFNVEMFKSKGYVLWITGVPLAFLGYFIPFVHLVEHTKQVFPGYSGEVLVTLIGGISGISRLVSGKLADFPQVNRVWIQQFSFVLLGISTTCIPYATHYGILVFLACVMGIADGCFVCMIGPIAYDLLGTKGMGQGIGILLGLMSIPMTAGPPLAGFIRGKMGTYQIAFLIAGVTPIIGACVLFLMPQSTHQPEVVEETIIGEKSDDSVSSSFEEEVVPLKPLEPAEFKVTHELNEGLSQSQGHQEYDQPQEGSTMA